MNGKEAGTKLRAVHCFYVGLLAKSRMEFTTAVEWLKEARRLAKIDATVDVSTVQTELIDTIKSVSPTVTSISASFLTFTRNFAILLIAA